ncbi:hypothetical protein ACVW0P_004018 [Mucilaginibacter sp. UYNi724]
MKTAFLTVIQLTSMAGLRNSLENHALYFRNVLRRW